MRKPNHQQVLFITLYGQKVEVDEEILEILEMFKRMGVITLHSCQGDDSQHGYISARRGGMNRFLKTMFSMYESDKFSPEVHELVRGFKRGYQETEFALRFRDGTYQVWSGIFSKGYKHPLGFHIEREWSNDHLPRIVIRWPYFLNETFLKMLQEIRA